MKPVILVAIVASVVSIPTLGQGLTLLRDSAQANYDFVVVKDLDGTKLAEWTGDLGAVNSEVLRRGRVTLHLYTDSSVTDWGLRLAGYSWR